MRLLLMLLLLCAAHTLNHVSTLNTPTTMVLALRRISMPLTSLIALTMSDDRFITSATPLMLSLRCSSCSSSSSAGKRHRQSALSVSRHQLLLAAVPQLGQLAVPMIRLHLLLDTLGARASAATARAAPGDTASDCASSP